jgi:hypothetical protein
MEDVNALIIVDIIAKLLATEIPYAAGMQPETFVRTKQLVLMDMLCLYA